MTSIAIGSASVSDGLDSFEEFGFELCLDSLKFWQTRSEAENNVNKRAGKQQNQGELKAAIDRATGKRVNETRKSLANRHIRSDTFIPLGNEPK